MAADELLDVSLNGLPILTFPCGWMGTVESIVNTALLWVGTQEEILEANADFLEYRKIWPVIQQLRLLLAI